VTECSGNGAEVTKEDVAGGPERSSSGSSTRVGEAGAMEGDWK